MSQEGKAIVTAAFRSTQSTLLTLLNYVKNFRQTVPTAYIVISIIFALINISLSMTRDDILFSDTPFITLAPLLCSFIPFFPPFGKHCILCVLARPTHRTTCIRQRHDNNQFTVSFFSRSLSIQK